MSELSRCRVAVLVLGDIGRSPRMQYHALSLAGAGAEVELVAYQDTLPRQALLEHPSIRIHRLPPAPLAAHRQGARLLYLPLVVARLAIECWRLYRCLTALPPLDWLLVQTPPAVPTFTVARLAARRHRARLLVDWHNLGHSLLALRLGRRSPWVDLAQRYEYRAACGADAHLAVSRALADHLRRRLGTDAIRVHYDSPDAAFRPLAGTARRRLRGLLAREMGLPAALVQALDGTGPEALLVVTASSWSADEDFDLMLQALERFDAAGTADGRVDLVFVAAGQGPGRARFDARVGSRSWRRIHVASTWLSAERYPDLLASADLGVCLHRSSSGLDLPMKLADMWGAGLPVLILDYGRCLRERLPPEHEALLFRDAGELADLLRTVPPRLAALRQTLGRQPARNWDRDWRRTVLPLLRRPS